MSDKLELRSPNGKYGITLSCQDDGAGIWVTSPNRGPCLALFNMRDQHGLGIYCKDHKGGGTTICLGTTEDGEPIIQFAANDGRIVYLSFSDVEKIVYQNPTAVRTQPVALTAPPPPTE